MKKVLTLILTLALATVSGQALAAMAKCTVTTVEEGTIILDCGKTAKAFKAGDSVQVKTTNKKAIEGC